MKRWLLILCALGYAALLVARPQDASAAVAEALNLCLTRVIPSLFPFLAVTALLLRLGMATTALAGAWLLTRGELDVLTFFLFLLTVSRLYDPLEGSLQNLAAIIATSTNIQRMNEIMDCPVQTGAEQLTNSGCDVTFDHVGFAYNDGEAVLRDVSFTARHGEVTALVGPSGGGKSPCASSSPGSTT